MKARVAAITIAALALLHVFLLGTAEDAKKELPAQTAVSFVLPSSILRIASFEFKGFASTMMFIRALVFEGSTYERTELPHISQEEWGWIHLALDASTDLDPYFFDPYFFANARMTWAGGMIRETNVLLEKGTRYRDWDWMLPFFVGFNYFYFLHDNSAAAEHLMTASFRPGPGEQLASLAARLAYKQNQTENAILFLEAILSRTDDERLKRAYQKRVDALRVRLMLERAVSRYTKQYGVTPSVLQDIVRKGLIRDVPRDPYGGKFTISPSGQINSTSDYLLMPRQR